MNGYQFSDKVESDLIKAGIYEVILDTAEVRSYKTDATKKYLSLKYVIRADVEQPHPNRVIFESVFRDKTNPDQFDHRKLQKIILTQKGKDTFQNSFANEDELIQYINGLTMQITIVEKEPDDYHDTDYNEVKYLSYKPSTVQLQQFAPKVSLDNPTVINYSDIETDEDLPF